MTATSSLTELARRVVACEHWRWMPGMSDRCGRVCVDASDPSDMEDGETQLVRWTQGHWKCTDYKELSGDERPDLSDPATLGCLLALVREAWGNAHVIETNDGRYVVCVWLNDERTKMMDVGEGATEAEALVVALEAK